MDDEFVSIVSEVSKDLKTTASHTATLPRTLALTTGANSVSQGLLPTANGWKGFVFHDVGHVWVDVSFLVGMGPVPRRALRDASGEIHADGKTTKLEKLDWTRTQYKNLLTAVQAAVASASTVPANLQEVYFANMGINKHAAAYWATPDESRKYLFTAVGKTSTKRLDVWRNGVRLSVWQSELPEWTIDFFSGGAGTAAVPAQEAKKLGLPSKVVSNGSFDTVAGNATRHTVMRGWFENGVPYSDGRWYQVQPVSATDAVAYSNVGISKPIEGDSLVYDLHHIDPCLGIKMEHSYLTHGQGILHSTFDDD